MRDDGFLGAGEPGVLDGLYRRFLDDPHSVPRDVARRFAWELECGGGPASGGESALAEAFRLRGHLAARLDPLGLRTPSPVPELEPAVYGVDPNAPLVARLRAAYCGSIGWEFAHIHDRERRTWLQTAAEDPVFGAPEPSDRLRLLTVLARTEAFEDFMHTRFPAVKRFGVEGAESFIAAVETILAESVHTGMEEAVIGGMHRGRLVFTALVAGKPLTPLLAEVKGAPPVPAHVDAAADVPYHLGHSGDRDIAGRTVHLSLSPHPSHLEVVGAVTLGRARAKQSRRGPGGRRAVLPLLVHTDASFAGQGIVAEMAQYSRLPPFTTGGTIHVVVNNQVGFTTTPEEGRSARYCTDVAKMVEAPVLHVNGDDPDAVFRAATVAARYRARFGGDVMIDLVCYRRHGHNEIDEPRFTQPRMYAAIDARPPIRRLYAEALTADGLDTGPAEAAAEAIRSDLSAGFDAVAGYEPNHADWFGGAWQGLRSAGERDMTAFVETGVALDVLRALGRALTTVPADFSLDSKVRRFLDQRRETVERGEGISWATAEALAFASLLAEGTPVRLGGQDTPRGAFTQRHLVLYDQRTEARCCVLDHLAEGQASAEVFNSPLTEYGVLGFEYGHSLADPHTLVVWEAQFGDFLNIAQAVFDQFIACGEDRWLRCSGLVMLLPHGLDGGGPDHSTARPERLLAACAKDNLQVVNASTPANFFHALRRQIHRPFRKPLAVLAPKALLRHRQAVSRLEDFGPGTGFRAVLPDDTVEKARRVVLCSGKVFYELASARAARGLEAEVALVRLEQLYPFPADALREALAPHPGAEVVWCQEEPENMGPFGWLDRRLEAVAGRRVRYVGRPPAATPAAGFKARHEAERQAVLDAALD